MFILTNKVSGLMVKGELDGDVMVLEDGSRVPVSLDPNGLYSSKVYSIGEEPESHHVPAAAHLPSDVIVDDVPNAPSVPVDVDGNDEDEDDEDLDDEQA